MSEVPVWFERKFRFDFPLELHPNLQVRLRGTPARLEDLAHSASRDALLHKPQGKWSAQEHAGHLGDLEPLWLARVEDFLADGRTMTAADLNNRATHEAHHNARDLTKILSDFRAGRTRLLARIGKFEKAELTRTLIHPRLGQPMRLIDHLYFIAEHDDHHLARIWELVG